MRLYPAKKLRGELTVPGDKSISHRGIMFGAIAEGTTELDGFLDGADCRSTIACFRALGIDIEQTGTHITVHGKGLHGLQAPDGILDVGNSGTTMRLISGILSAQDFSCTCASARCSLAVSSFLSIFSSSGSTRLSRFVRVRESSCLT